MKNFKQSFIWLSSLINSIVKRIVIRTLIGIVIVKILLFLVTFDGFASVSAYIISIWRELAIGFFPLISVVKEDMKFEETLKEVDKGIEKKEDDNYVFSIFGYKFTWKKILLGAISAGIALFIASWIKQFLFGWFFDDFGADSVKKVKPTVEQPVKGQRPLFIVDSNISADEKADRVTFGRPDGQQIRPTNYRLFPPEIIDESFEVPWTTAEEEEAYAINKSINEAKAKSNTKNS